MHNYSLKSLIASGIVHDGPVHDSIVQIFRLAVRLWVAIHETYCELLTVIIWLAASYHKAITALNVSFL
jgi:hypothetical protein